MEKQTELKNEKTQAPPKKNEKAIVPEENEKIQKLIEAAIPIKYAKFHATVDNTDQNPEQYFSEISDKPTRRAQMWASYAYLICLHKGQYILVPLSNVAFTKAK